MGRRTTLRPRAKQTNRPSAFFLITLAVGLLVLAWGVVVSMKRIPKAKPKAVSSLEEYHVHHHHEPLVDLSTAFEL